MARFYVDLIVDRPDGEAAQRAICENNLAILFHQYETVRWLHLAAQQEGRGFEL